MKKLLLISILLSLPVFAADVDQYGIPYCQTEQDYNCRVKNNFDDEYNWYQVIEQRWTNNGTELKNFIIKLGFESPYQSYKKLCYDFKITENVNDQDWSNLYRQRLENGYYNKTNFYMWKQFLPNIINSKN